MARRAERFIVVYKGHRDYPNRWLRTTGWTRREAQEMALEMNRHGWPAYIEPAIVLTDAGGRVDSSAVRAVAGTTARRVLG